MSELPWIDEARALIAAIEAHLDAEKMARLAATAHDVFGMDTIMPVFHSQLESDALGGDTEWAEKDNWPSPSRFT